MDFLGSEVGGGVKLLKLLSDRDIIESLKYAANTLTDWQVNTR